MPRSRPDTNRRDAGISLIEVLVGVSILGIVAFAITLSLQPQARPLDRETDRLALRLSQAAEEAVATGSPVGLSVEAGGQSYAFYRYVDRRWWVLRDHPALSAHRLDEAVRLDVADGYLAAMCGAVPPKPRLPRRWPHRFSKMAVTSRARPPHRSIC